MKSITELRWTRVDPWLVAVSFSESHPAAGLTLLEFARSCDAEAVVREHNRNLLKGEVK